MAILTRLSGVLVVDVDTKSEAKPGLVSLDRLVQEGLVVSPCRVETPSGGQHLYYRTTRGFAKDILGGPGDSYPGIDFKVWGLVAAPPSVRPNGIAYCGEPRMVRRGRVRVRATHISIMYPSQHNSLRRPPPT